MATVADKSMAAMTSLVVEEASKPEPIDCAVNKVASFRAIHVVIRAWRTTGRRLTASLSTPRSPQCRTPGRSQTS
jgi:hypothetical protein